MIGPFLSIGGEVGMKHGGVPFRGTLPGHLGKVEY